MLGRPSTLARTARSGRCGSPSLTLPLTPTLTLALALTLTLTLTLALALTLTPILTRRATEALREVLLRPSPDHHAQGESSGRAS